MAYVVVSFKDQDVGRWPLDRTLTIGRAGECDVVIRDILLSRRHCQIEADGKSWVAVDLGSKNGTRRGRHRITRQSLRDGDVLTMGKTKVRFVVGRLPVDYAPPTKRPSDPFEALSGTVSDFDPRAAERYCKENGLPKPQPIPRDPVAYANDDLYGLLNEIASSSWDSIYAQASQPRPTAARRLPRAPLPAGVRGGGAAVAMETGGVATMPLKRSRLAFSEELQVKEHRPGRQGRPATPMDLPNFQRAGSTLSALAPAAEPNTFRERLGVTLSALARPLIALHRWISPTGRIRLF